MPLSPATRSSSRRSSSEPQHRRTVMKKTTDREKVSVADAPPLLEPRHIMDYVRVLYKRRWIAVPVFLILFVIGLVNTLRQTPVYQAHSQLLIETDTPKVARLDQMFESENYWDDEFRQTQYRILQSRTLSK